MNRKAWLLMLALMLPAGSALAGVAVEIVTPGMVLHIGDRDRRGYYWDGFDWRSPYWWHDHRGRYWGARNRQGFYWNGWRWVATQRHGATTRRPHSRIFTGRRPFIPPVGPRTRRGRRPARRITAGSTAMDITANRLTPTTAVAMGRTNRRRIKPTAVTFHASPYPRAVPPGVFLCLTSG